MPVIFHIRLSTCKYYLHSSLTLSILMCIPLQPIQRGAPSTARSPGGWGAEVGDPEDDESLSSISPSFWSPEPLAEGLLWFHVFFNDFSEMYWHTRSYMHLMCTFLWVWTSAKQPWHHRHSRGNRLIHHLPESPCLPLFLLVCFYGKNTYRETHPLHTF